MAVVTLEVLKSYFQLGKNLTPGNYEDLIDTLVSMSGGGSGDSTKSGPYANIPNVSEGDVFFPTDGTSIERSSAQSWTPWGPIFPFTKPVLSSFSWVNQGLSTAVSEQGGIYIRGEPYLGTASVRLLKKSAPSTTPYTICLGMIPSHNPNANSVCGLAFRQNSNEKIEALLLRVTSGAYGLRVWRYDNASTWSSEQYSVGASIYSSSVVWMKISDDGTDRKYYVSSDGQHWREVYAVSRTSYLTADEVGFFVDANYDGTNDPAMFVVSWKEN